MPDDAHADLLELAKEIAIEAGEAVLEVYDKGEFDAYQKTMSLLSPAQIIWQMISLISV